MIRDRQQREFAVQLARYGFEVHDNRFEFEADVISPQRYGSSPLLRSATDDSVNMLFWYNYPGQLLPEGMRIVQRRTTNRYFERLLTHLGEYGVSHGLLIEDTAKLLNYHIYGGSKSEIQNGYQAYTEVEILRLVTMRHIEPYLMNTLLAGHLAFEHINNYDPAITPEIYMDLYPTQPQTP